MGRTVILVASDSTVAGLIAIADEVRPGTAEAITALRKMGVKNITMLTGDNEMVAKAVSTAIGIDELPGKPPPGAETRCGNGTPGERAARGDDRRRYQ